MELGHRQSARSPEASAHFGKNLRAERLRADMTQARLAALTGLHSTEISLLERGGREPRLSTIIRLRDALGVALDDLCAGLCFTPPGEVTQVQAADDDKGRDRAAARKSKKQREAARRELWRTTARANIAALGLKDATSLLDEAAEFSDGGAAVSLDVAIKRDAVMDFDAMREGTLTARVIA